MPRRSILTARQRAALFDLPTDEATVSEAPYILDGLLMNEAGRKITEQYADTGGFTDQVFAVTALLSYRFIPRIRDLPTTRLYLFDPATAPSELRGGLIGGKIREGIIVQNWPGVLRRHRRRLLHSLERRRRRRRMHPIPLPLPVDQKVIC